MGTTVDLAQAVTIGVHEAGGFRGAKHPHAIVAPSVVLRTRLGARRQLVIRQVARRGLAVAQQHGTASDAHVVLVRLTFRNARTPWVVKIVSEYSANGTAAPVTIITP